MKENNTYIDPNYPEVTGLIINLSNKFAPHDADLRSDYQQEAWYNFYRRLNEFDKSKASLLTFAYQICRGAMLHYSRDNSKIIRNPGWVSDIIVHFNKRKEELGEELSETDLEEYATLKGKSVASIKKALLSEHETQAIATSELLDSDNTQMAYTPPEFAIIEEFSILNDYLPRLKDKEREVLYNRFIKQETKTNTAKIMGISINYVAYLEKRAIQKLNEWAAQDEII